MDKRADNQFPIHELLRQRYSPRAFSERTLDDEQLSSLFEAARWSPSCFNEQPWRFIVARRDNPDEFQAMLACLDEGNQPWAAHAAALFISVARTTFTHNDKPNRHAWYDLGQSVALLTVQAMSMGLYAHQMAGFDPDKARATYDIPAGFEPASAVALGHLGDPSALPEPYRTRELGPRTRKPLADLVYTRAWGQSLIR